MNETTYEGSYSMYDRNLQMSFLRYRIGGERYNEQPCQRRLTQYQYEMFMHAINTNMHYKLYLDGLPAAVINRNPVTGDVSTDYKEGVPVGRTVWSSDGDTGSLTKKFILYNHWNIVVKVHPVENSNQVQVVGFEIEPRSYTPSIEPERSPNWEYKVHRPLYLDDLIGMEQKEQYFQFTYSY